MNIPWWSKIGFKLILSRLPFGYAVWQRIGLFRHGSMDKCDYAINVFGGHMAKAGLTANLAGKTILELGPGDSISSAIISAAHGAQAILVDTGPFVRGDIIPYIKLTKVLRENGLAPTDLTTCKNIQQILSLCHAQYLTSGLRSLSSIESASVDMIFSHAVLEHVRVSEFAAIQTEIHRILKPHSYASHCIDLKDHLGGSLNNLRFSRETWESDLFTKSGFYTNRIRYRQMLEQFKKAKYSVIDATPQRWDSLPISRSKLAEEFRILPEDELLISSFDVLLQKN
jgi:hypothetical protein